MISRQSRDNTQSQAEYDTIAVRSRCTLKLAAIASWQDAYVCIRYQVY